LTPYVEFDEEGHRYFVDGRERRSVTQLLVLAGYIDPRWFDEHSRWRGTEVHRLTMLEDRQAQPLDLRTVKPELRGYMKGWRRWKADLGIEYSAIVLIEHRVLSHNAGTLIYCGTLDRVIRLPNGRLILIDLKTNKQGMVAKWTRLQTAAYGHALNPKKWWERRGVCLKPDGTYNTEIYPASDHRRDADEFLHSALACTQQLEAPKQSPGLYASW
jgi:hypothetical protein